MNISEEARKATEEILGDGDNPECEIIQRAINEATSEKDKEIGRMRSAIFRLIGDDLSAFNAYKEKAVYDLVLNRGCGVTKIGNPMEGYDFTCAHEYEWDCNNCPIVTNDRVLASGEEG